MQNDITTEKAEICFAKYQVGGILPEREGRLALIAFTGDEGVEGREFRGLHEFISFVSRLSGGRGPLFNGQLTLLQFLENYCDSGLSRDQLVHIFDFYSRDGLLSAAALE